jgi:hypothetical protein
VFSGVRNPLSNFTIAAMADMGYDVNYNGADSYSIDDLGVCGTSCPEAFSFRERGLGSTNRRQLAEEAKMIVRNDFKDILRNYHNELEKSNFIQGEAGYYVMEKVDVLVKEDDDGHLHTVTVTYDDVKEMQCRAIGTTLSRIIACHIVAKMPISCYRLVPVRTYYYM